MSTALRRVQLAHRLVQHHVRAALFLAVAMLGVFAPAVSGAQRVPLDSVRINDTTIVYAVTMIDGSKLVGRITALSADSLQIRSASSVASLARSAVRDVTAYSTSSMHNGELWFENPHATRLLFSPTAIPLRKGEGYFADFWIFLVSAAVGVTDRFTIGAGATVFPTSNFGDNVFYAIPKYTVIDRPRTKVALGALAATVPWDHSHKSLGVLYGVGTLGSRENNITLGTGFGYVGGTLSKTPIITLGGQTRVSKRVALTTENWFVSPGKDNVGFVTYGFRFLGEKIAADLAFGFPTTGGVSFPGVPLLGFATKF